MGKQPSSEASSPALCACSEANPVAREGCLLPGFDDGHKRATFRRKNSDPSARARRDNLGCRVPGFGAQRRRSKTVSYFVFYRTQEGRQRWHTIGRAGSPWTPDTARDEALQVLAKAAAGGGDPAADKQAGRKAHTVSELCDMCWAGRRMTRSRKPKKANTLAAFYAGNLRIEDDVELSCGDAEPGVRAMAAREVECVPVIA
jgi:hypothetical protein